MPASTITLKQAAVVLAAMEKELAGLDLDPLDFPGTWTKRQGDAYEARKRELHLRISRCRNAMSILARFDPQIAAVTPYLKQLDGDIRKQLKKMLVDLAPTDPKRWNVELSLKTLEHGRGALEDTGYVLSTTVLGQLLAERQMEWCGSVAEVDERLDEWKQQRVLAQMTVDEACALSPFVLPAAPTVSL